MPIQAYFDDIQLHIAHELRQAQSHIVAAIAWFTDAELYRIVCQCAERGVEVSILLVNDNINTANYGLDFERLENLGGKVHWIDNNDDSLMHNKFCVIDQQTVITGSYNWTVRAQRNDENITIIKDEANFAADFLLAFNALQIKYGIITNQQLTIDDVFLELNLEIKALEIQIGSLRNEKADIEKAIYEFKHHFNTELGDLLHQILALKHQIAELQLQQTPKSKSKQQYYEQTQRDYEQFNQSFEQTKQQNNQELPQNLARELKDKFRRATKLCYPDLVKPEHAADAQKIFVALKAAYDANDLKGVSDILDYLENGKPFLPTNSQTTKQQLLARCKHLLQALQQLQTEINHLKNSETYQTILQHSNNWNDYFVPMKAQLQTELTNLNTILTALKIKK